MQGGLELMYCLTKELKIFEIRKQLNLIPNPLTLSEDEK